MAGPGGREVGRVSVRVVPDTSRFKEKLEAFLRKVEQTAKVKVGIDVDDRPLKRLPRSIPPLNPKVKPDTTPVNRELEAINAKLKATFARVAVDADPSKALREFDRLMMRAKELDPTISIDADTDAALSRARSLVAQVETARPKVRFDVNPAEREIEALQGRMKSLFAKIAVDADPSKALAEFDRLMARARSLDPTVQIDAETGRALARARALVAQINAQKATIEVDVDMDRRGLGGIGGGRGGLGSLDSLTGVFTRLFSVGSKLPSMLGSVFSSMSKGAEIGGGLASSLGEAAGTLGGFTSILGRAGGPIGAAIAALIGLGTAVVGVGAKFAAIGVVVGAITFAVGALGAAVSGLPALLFAVAGAGAAVFLGFDGIKKAAQVAKPALDQLKVAISGVFERNLTPMFREIATNLLPNIRVGLEGVAQSVSMFIANLAKVFTSVEGVRMLNEVLGNTRIFIDTMAPGVRSLIESLLRVATVSGAWRLLGEIVGGLSAKVGELFTRFAEGGESSLMVRSLTQLRDVLMSAADVFNTLVLKATEFFTGAGPGVRELFDAINRTLKEIDFKSFGESFGIFAAAAGRLIDSVPPAVWDQIADAVRRLAEKFAELANNPRVQLFFTGLISMIPIAVDMFTRFLDVVQMVADWVGRLVENAVRGWARLQMQFVIAKAYIADFVGNVREKFAEIGRTISEKLSEAGRWVQQKFADMGRSVVEFGTMLKQRISEAWTNAVTTIRTKITDAVTAVREFPQRAKAALGDLGSLLVESGRRLVQGFINGIKAMAGQVAAAARSVVDAARGFFPFSPAKEGPFSGRGWVLYSGYALGAAFASGILARRGIVGNAARALVGTAASPFAGAQLTRAFAAVDAQLVDALGTRSQYRSEAFDRARAFVDGLRSGLAGGVPAVAREIDRVSAAVTAAATGPDELGPTRQQNAGVTVNVYGAQGQDVDQLADAVVQKIDFGLKL